MLALRLLLAAVFILPTFGVHAGVVFTSLYSFIHNEGTDSEADLVKGSDGNFYGTTSAGGTNNAGTVFRISSTGAFSSLYSFTGGNDGASPYAGLVQGSDGDFYGTTFGGGSNDFGTLFKINTNGTLTNLYSFTGAADGADPEADLLEGSDGNFYGTTYSGGTNGHGTVFKISAAGAFTSLFSFTGGSDGAGPAAGLTQASDGSFYGTTSRGGDSNAGTVFKISASGVFNRLHSFTGGNDGANPFAGLVQGSDGNFYGTTVAGGTNGYGIVFKISARGAFASLHSFTHGIDGAYSYAGLIRGNEGNFYGTTYSGGTNDYGTVFKITATGAFTSLYSFTGGNDGGYPFAALVQGSNGNFYGTTFGGGRVPGTVFRLTVNDPPVSRIGGPYTAECHGAVTTVQLDGSASSDPDGDALTYHWSSDCPDTTFSDPASPTPVLTIDSTAAQVCTLTLAVSDGEFTNSSQTTVTVVDTQSPKFSHVSATPANLWPPDNKMVLVTVSAQVTDNCDPDPVYRIVAVFSNDLDHGRGRSREPDFQITGDHTVLLRAERSDDREPRTYRLLLQAKDATGNTAVKSVSVAVEDNHKRKDEPHW
ncbi:MAG TPA: choice-of-anchor tandem repeat GloVer-containing protein [Verrucomicrobiae bacterium]|nr:choice-of-anchor tandem repeat GloVer-containing protein [Verrucomicrobiae bacterium]